MINPNDRCLIVEDNFVILMDLEDMVKSMGFKFADHAASVAQAMELLDKTRYRVAFLDLQLGSESSVTIAEKLNERKIPFAITTAYCVEDERPGPLLGVPIISKPYSIDAVNRTLRSLLKPLKPVSQLPETPASPPPSP
jgi:DNA-binding response OmpR family regulator